jgi:DNA-binding transcriptional LysR family regulator
MVERKLGLSFLPLFSVTHELRQGKLVTIDITNAEPLRRNLDVIHPRHRPLTRNAQTLLVLLRAAAAAVPSDAKPKKAARTKKKSR